MRRNIYVTLLIIIYCTSLMFVGCSKPDSTKKGVKESQEVKITDQAPEVNMKLNNDVVIKLKLTSREKKSFFDEERKYLDTGLLMQVNNKGDIYVYRTYEQKILIFTPNGKLKRSILVKEIKQPTKFSINAIGSFILIVDSFNYKILVLDSEGNRVYYSNLPEPVIDDEYLGRVFPKNQNTFVFDSGYSFNISNKKWNKISKFFMYGLDGFFYNYNGSTVLRVYSNGNKKPLGYVETPGHLFGIDSKGNFYDESFKHIINFDDKKYLELSFDGQPTLGFDEKIYIIPIVHLDESSLDIPIYRMKNQKPIKLGNTFEPFPKHPY